MTEREVLTLLLRLIGSVSLTAVVFVAVPYSWMDAIHSRLGMGRLPDAPVVGYLARSTSAFYAILGGLFWLVSSDLDHHRLVAVYLGATLALLGAVLLAVDWWEGLPLFWKVWEGPFVIAFGLAVFALGLRIG